MCLKVVTAPAARRRPDLDRRRPGPVPDAPARRQAPPRARTTGQVSALACQQYLNCAVSQAMVQGDLIAERPAWLGRLQCTAAGLTASGQPESGQKLASIPGYWSSMS